MPAMAAQLTQRYSYLLGPYLLGMEKQHVSADRSIWPTMRTLFPRRVGEHGPAPLTNVTVFPDRHVMG